MKHLWIGAAFILTPIAGADVSPVRSSVEPSAYIELLPLGLTDSGSTLDDQPGTLDPLGPLSAGANLSTNDGFFDASAAGQADFTNASSGSFSANMGYEGFVIAGDPKASGFLHSTTSIFQYDFFTNETGSITLSGSMFNGGPSSTSFLARVRLYKESEPDAGFGSPLNNTVFDFAGSGTTFSYTHALDGATGNYRVEFVFTHLGNTDPDALLAGGSFAGMFLIETNQCPADFNSDNTLDVFDVFAFLDAFNASDLSADFTEDGTLDIFDVFAFLDAFKSGCA